MPLDKYLSRFKDIRSYIGAKGRFDMRLMFFHYLEIARDLGKELEFWEKLYKYFVPSREKVLSIKP